MPKHEARPPFPPAQTTPENAASPFSIVGIPRHASVSRSPSIVLHKYGFKLSVPNPSVVPQAPKNNKRGAITGMSWESAARLRAFAIEHSVPGHTLWSMTGTTRAVHSPDDWRAIMQRFQKLLTRAGAAGIWRVELQRRKAPHVHMLIYWPNKLVTSFEEMPGEIVSRMWHQAIGLINRQGFYVDGSTSERMYSAQCSLGTSPEWVVYLAGHASKHKEGQLGWLGKQWGIWNRAAFTPTVPLLATEMPLSASKRFWRTYRRYCAAEMRNKGFKSHMRSGITGERVRCVDGTHWLRVVHWSMQP